MLSWWLYVQPSEVASERSFLPGAAVLYESEVHEAQAHCYESLQVQAPVNFGARSETVCFKFYVCSVWYCGVKTSKCTPLRSHLALQAHSLGTVGTIHCDVINTELHSAQCMQGTFACTLNKENETQLADVSQMIVTKALLVFARCMPASIMLP
jgi:hypothetical protein